jgi:hypothetical protein
MADCGSPAACRSSRFTGVCHKRESELPYSLKNALRVAIGGLRIHTSNVSRAAAVRSTTVSHRNTPLFVNFFSPFIEAGVSQSMSQFIRLRARSSGSTVRAKSLSPRLAPRAKAS